MVETIKNHLPIYPQYSEEKATILGTRLQKAVMSQTLSPLHFLITSEYAQVSVSGFTLNVFLELPVDCTLKEKLSGFLCCVPS